MSMSIPFFFEAPQFDGAHFDRGDHYIDGGVLMNYPLHMFDGPEYETDNPWFVNDVNWETLGCYLYEPKDCPSQKRPITNMLSYVENLLETLHVVQDVAYQNNTVDHERTIEISNCCVSIVDFKIKPDSNEYKQLVEAGRQATLAYLQSDKPRLNIMSKEGAR
jgi:predicted acylesterase/phospholipase RssA